MDQITQLIANEILSSPELIRLIDQRAGVIVKTSSSMPQYITRNQLAEIWQVSKQTVDRMTDEEIRDQGFTRKKIGVSVRFERKKV